MGNKMTEEKKIEKKIEGGTVVGENKDKGIIYVQHPVTAKQKKELLKKGKIIDAKFKP